MSRKPTKNSNPEDSESLESASLDEESNVPANGADEEADTVSPPNSDATAVESNLTEDEEMEEEEEFSLDQLSQAYAEVLKQNNPDVDLPELTVATAGASDAADEEVVTESRQPEPAEADDNAACPISPESIIEAILFVGAPKDVKLTSRKVAAVLRDVSPKEVTKIVRELNAKYEDEDAAFRIQSEGGVFKMILDPKLEDFQREFFGRNRQVRLSQAAIDVMAVVAYNQPTTREQVEKIRAKPSGSVLNQLVKRELLQIDPGETNSKIKYYSTTDRFLELFNLDEIADLPQSHEASDIEELAD